MGLGIAEGGREGKEEKEEAGLGEGQDQSRVQDPVMRCGGQRSRCLGGIGAEGQHWGSGAGMGGVMWGWAGR